MSLFEKTLVFIRDASLIGLVVLLGVSYHPVIIRMSRMAGYDSGTILSRYIVLLFAGVLALTVIVGGFSFFKSRVIRTSLVLLVLVSLSAFAAIAFFRNRSITVDIKSIAIVIGAIIIGWNMNNSKSFRYILIMTFCTVTIFSGIMQIIVNIGGFVIADRYLTDAKNSLGAMLATVSIASLYFLFDSKNRFITLFGTVGLVLSVLVMLVIRSRMALLTAAFLLVLYSYLRFKNKNILIIASFATIALIIAFFLIPSSVFDFINSSFTAGTQGEDFTSGRMGTYRVAFNYFMSHPLLGNIDKSATFGWVHNYPLLKLSEYGILFSSPILILYVFYFIKSTQRSLKNSGFICFSNILLLAPEIISMAEPTFPFGPGTVTVFNFILFGCAEKYLYLKTQRIDQVPQDI